MKVLYILNKCEIGGATKSALTLIELLKENGVEPIVISPKKSGVVENFCKRKKIDFYYVRFKEIGYSFSVPFYKKIIKLCFFPFMYLYNKIYNKILSILLINNFKEIDLIHTNVGRDDFGIYLSKKYKINHIMHLREFGTLDFHCKYLSLNYYKYINDGTIKFIAISKSIKDFYVSKGIPSSKIEIIYNGIDVNKIKIKKSVRKDSLKFKIITFSGISKEKGQIQIIEAMNLLPSEIKKNVFLDLYGGVTSEYKEKLMNKIELYQLKKNVTFKGYVDNIYDNLNKYDVSITTSKSEAFGRVTAECMLSKLSVIVSNTGANIELIKNKIDGLVYKYGDINDLVEKIIYYYKNRDVMEKYSENAYNSALKKFTADVNMKNVLELYYKLKDNGCE